MTIDSRGPATDEWILGRIDAFIADSFPDLAGEQLTATRERFRAAITREMNGRVLVAVSGEPELIGATREYADKRIEVEVDPTPIPEDETEGDGEGEGGDGTGEGGGAGGRTGAGGWGRGRGGRGGPLGEVAGEAPANAAFWPGGTAGAESWTCEPFDEERSLPEVSAINPSVGERLTAGMERLARELEIPTCQYAGHFALNACRAIGAIAHGIGLSARDNPGSTEVTVAAERGRQQRGRGHHSAGDARAALPAPPRQHGRWRTRLRPGRAELLRRTGRPGGGLLHHAVEHLVLNEMGDALESSCGSCSPRPVEWSCCSS